MSWIMTAGAWSLAAAPATKVGAALFDRKLPADKLRTAALTMTSAVVVFTLAILVARVDVDAAISDGFWLLVCAAQIVSLAWLTRLAVRCYRRAHELARRRGAEQNEVAVR